MAKQDIEPRLGTKWYTTVLAVVYGLLIALVAANVWPLLLLHLGAPLAAGAEVLFLSLYIWWAAGGGPPRAWQAARAARFRATSLTPTQWTWGLLAAVFFAVTVHAAIVVLFRLVPFPVADFRHGYDFSFIPSLPLKWLAVVVSAASAGICEETGFRGYMQLPLERRHGAPSAILISSLGFMLVHLSKGWATLGMVPIVFGAGVLLGILAWASGSLIPSIVGHILMDIGLFAFWWTGIAGDFTARPISETGMDQAFFIACGTFAASLLIVSVAIGKLRREKDLVTVSTTLERWVASSD
jgi:membrane protease YdiL (CAAX protease family)